jgi:hypothetical protein
MSAKLGRRCWSATRSGIGWAHRANKIAYALVRDQVGYDPARWA